MVRKVPGGFQRAPAVLLPAPVRMSSLLAYFGEADRKTSPVHLSACPRHLESALDSRSESRCTAIMLLRGHAAPSKSPDTRLCSAARRSAFTARREIGYMNLRRLNTATSVASSSNHSPFFRFA